MAPSRPRAIVFYAGENDIDAGKSVSQMLSDFDTFMELKVRALGATPVYFISLKPSIRRFEQQASPARASQRTNSQAGGASHGFVLHRSRPFHDAGRETEGALFVGRFAYDCGRLRTVDGSDQTGPDVSLGYGATGLQYAHRTRVEANSRLRTPQRSIFRLSRSSLC